MCYRMIERWVICWVVAAVVGGTPAWGQMGVTPGPITPGPLQPSAESPRGVPAERLRAAGIRQLRSRHLVLYTDVASDAEVDRLPEWFDQAAPQWAEYFGIDRARLVGWQARAYLVGERERFDALGLMPPAGHDQFAHGISIGAELWLYDQPTPYYRRHLLLHEGTHVFMASHLGGCGPGWYMEGTAELMATHRLSGDRLVLRTMPQSRAEVPMLGRLKLIDEAREAGRLLPLAGVMRIDNRRQLGTDVYAWAWAAAKFLDSHPRYREQFRRLTAHVLDADFNATARSLYGDDWAELLAEWEAVVATLDHGYDFERMAIDFRRGMPIGPRQGPRAATVSAERGWQSSGVWLEAGQSYRVTASGRYQVATEPASGEPWISEPGGVTLEYNAGRPLGALLGAVHAEAMPAETRPAEEGGAPRIARGPATQAAGGGFAEPIKIGLQRVLTPAESGTLYLRVNDSGGRLGDNRGTVSVVVERAADDRP